MFAASKTSTAAQGDPFFNNVTALVNTSGTNGAQNNTFIDSSTNNFTLTRFGNATQGSFSPYGENWSNFFNGVSDELVVASNDAFKLGTGNFTVEMWINPTEFTGVNNGTLFNIGTYITGLFIRVTSSIINVYILNSERLKISRGTIITINNWYHLALVRNGSTCTLYVNGNSIGTFTESGSISPTDATIKIAKSAHSSTETHVGYISNLRLVKGTAIYTANFTPPTAPLQPVAGTSLLTCQSPGIVDNSSNQFTITRTGDVRTQRFAPFALLQPYTPEVFGGSLYFDGTGDYVQTAYNAAFALGTKSFTIEAWIYPLTTATQAGIISNWQTDGQFILRRVNTNRLQFVFTTSTTVTFNATTTTVISNSWNHVAIVRNGSSFRLYLNGVQDGATLSNSASITGTGKVMRVGADGDASALFNGYISDARIVNGTALYTSNFTPPTAPLIPVTNTALLLNATNAGIYDASAMNVFETVGNAQVSTSVKQYGTSSVAFDGVGDHLVTSYSTPNPLLAFGTGAFTIEFWFYANSNSGTQQLFDTRPVGGTSTSQYMVITYLSGSLNYSTAQQNPAIAGGAVGAEGWNYVALARSGTSTRLFINGAQVGSTYTDSQNYLIGINRPIIGADGSNPANSNFNGYIQDLRITRGIARYTANFTPPTAPLPTF